MKERVKSESKWLALRKTMVTATEAPILLGLNPYETPNRLMKEKKESTFFGNAYTIIGQWLEEVVVKATNYSIGSDFKVIEDETGKLFYSRKDCRLGATPDAIQKGQFLECKTTKPANYIRYSHCPPKYYLMQLMTQLHCADFNSGYLSIMSTDLTQTSEQLNLDLSIFEVQRNKTLCDLLEEEVNRFWECEKAGKMFRMKSKYKKQANLLISMSYRKIL